MHRISEIRNCLFSVIIAIKITFTIEIRLSGRSKIFSTKSVLDNSDIPNTNVFKLIKEKCLKGDPNFQT